MPSILSNKLTLEPAPFGICRIQHLVSKIQSCVAHVARPYCRLQRQLSCYTDTHVQQLVAQANMVTDHSLSRGWSMLCKA